MLVGILQIVLSEPVYEASARLTVDHRSISLSNLGQAINDQRSELPSGANLLATQMELIKSEQVLQPALERIESQSGINDDTLTTSELKSNLSIRVVPATNILELKYADSDPNTAALILSAISESAASRGIESVRLEAASARSFLERQVSEQAARLEIAEEAESRYRQETGIVSLDIQTENLVQSLTQLQDQERDIVSQLEESRTQSAMLGEITGSSSLENAYNSVRAGQDETINQLEEQLLALDTAVIENQARLGPQHPEMVGLLEQHAEVRNLYEQAVSGIITAPVAEQYGSGASAEISQDLISQYIVSNVQQGALEEKLDTVRLERAQLENTLSQIPNVQQPLASLVREREAAANALSLLRSKLEEARIAEAQIVNNTHLISPTSVPSSPVSSKRGILLISVAAGLFLSVLVILLLEALDDCLHDVQELEAIVDFPILGTLPRSLPQIPEPRTTQSFLQQPQWTEPYRLILRTLDFQSHKRTNLRTNIFVISGVQEFDGQSLFTANLAAVAAHSACRSLILDLGYGQPRQSRFFDVSLEDGLPHSLKDAAHDELESLLTSGSTQNIDIVTRKKGDREHHLDINISELPEMHALLTTASERYDFVAILTSAIAACADAISLSHYGAGLILVVQSNATSKSSLRQVVNDLQKSGTSVLGAVMAQTPDLGNLEYQYIDLDSKGSLFKSTKVV